MHSRPRDYRPWRSADAIAERLDIPQYLISVTPF
jgi:hypothetical protein